MVKVIHSKLSGHRAKLSSHSYLVKVVQSKLFDQSHPVKVIWSKFYGQSYPVKVIWSKLSGQSYPIEVYPFTMQRHLVKLSNQSYLVKVIWSQLFSHGKSHLVTSHPVKVICGQIYLVKVIRSPGQVFKVILGKSQVRRISTKNLRRISMNLDRATFYTFL